MLLGIKVSEVSRSGSHATPHERTHVLKLQRTATVRHFVRVCRPINCRHVSPSKPDSRNAEFMSGRNDMDGKQRGNLFSNEKRWARWKPYKNSLAHKVLSDVSNQNEFFFLFAERLISPFYGLFFCSESESGVACPSPTYNNKSVLDRAIPKTCQFFLDILPFKASEKCSAFTRFSFDPVNLEHTGISLIGEAVKRFQETPLHTF